ncbi:hypothetical protein LTR96_009505 [Exophiala xenobiotica]|nr:hypothetical protein LTR41_008085 [Exophiala xenobiotica]KAK5217233.1 hypothetical protein LTR72_009799 [Exophiala xenobiotica]KAK5265138.1 hypothetical protein LTR96_009505 [Exophiala xenobiotica]KAK5279763.1 hypothetical protein LTR40_007315 [Exophiala xenobiotica]KAK5287470.1 hypothetical protein LTR14_009133 [Exophiala xenobiotica]
MDLDISDILADVSRHNHSQSSYANSHSHSHSTDSDTDIFTDHQLLTRAWTSERCAPDLLPYPTELMDRVMSRVQAQIAKIEDLASGMGDGQLASVPGGAAAGGGGTQNANLVLSILQTDLSRTQFVVRSFLRQRLAKMTKYATFYLGLSKVPNQNQDHKSLSGHLSTAEVQFLRNHQALLSEFYDVSFLSAFPAGLRRLYDTSGGVSMVEGPNSGQAVVVRCLGEMWANAEDVERGVEERERGVQGDGDREGGAGAGASVELRMRRGEVWVVRWRDVRGGVERGDLELL